MKKYYGIRYWSGRSTTTGTPNPITGRMSKAVDIEVFRSKKDRDEWLRNEKLSAPCGLGGGERIAATKKLCRQHRLGCSVEDFELDLICSENMNYEE